MTALDALIRAKTRIETIGWIRGSSYKFDGDGSVCAYCLATALCAGEIETEAVRRAAKEVCEVLNLNREDLWNQIIIWNDKQGRKLADIVWVLTKAIESTKSK